MRATSGLGLEVTLSVRVTVRVKVRVTLPVKTTRIPERLWQDLALELLGPMPTGVYLLVLVDYFSQ